MRAVLPRAGVAGVPLGVAGMILGTVVCFLAASFGVGVGVGVANAVSEE